MVSDPESLPELSIVPSPREAQHLDLPAGRIEEPLEDLHGRGLSRAVGAQQTEALARPDLEIQASNRLHRRSARVGLAEIPATNGCAHLRGIILLRKDE
jgi:hypothetical protein